MNSTYEDIKDLTYDEIITIINENDLGTSYYGRIKGVYAEIGVSSPYFLGVEGVYYRGVDTYTGSIVEALYSGLTLGVSSIPVNIGVGQFSFSA